MGEANNHTFPGNVLVIGVGLLGTSIGLALSDLGVKVQLVDTSPVALALAADMGAGEIYYPAPRITMDTIGELSPAVDVLKSIEKPVAQSATDQPEMDIKLVIVATPPDVAGAVAAESLFKYPNALVTDVASVKTRVLQDIRRAVAQRLGLTGQMVETPDLGYLLADQEQENQVKEVMARYIGSHPMAGRERSGAAFARSDLFYGRPWVVVPHCDSSASAIRAMKTLATDLGALPVEMEADEHDAAVALVSHVPQLISSTLASRLAQAPIESLGLAGQGLRDLTRIAKSDPKLWSAIIAGNTKPIVKVLQEIQSDLAQLIGALEHDSGSSTEPALYYSPGVIGAITATMHQGNLGVGRIPGKHGGAPRRYAEALVVIPDRPGYLGKLFQDVGELDVNIEDLNLEHSPGAAAGICQLLVEPAQLQPLTQGLTNRGWKITAG